MSPAEVLAWLKKRGKTVYWLSTQTGYERSQLGRYVATGSGRTKSGDPPEHLARHLQKMERIEVLTERIAELEWENLALHLAFAMKSGQMTQEQFNQSLQEAASFRGLPPSHAEYIYNAVVSVGGWMEAEHILPT